MKHLLVASFLVLFALPVFAQESAEEIDLDIPGTAAPVERTAPSRPRYITNWVFGGAVMQWSEEMRFRQNGVTKRTVANFNSAILQAYKEFTFYRAGYSLGFFVGSGKANGDAAGIYDEGNIVYSVLGAQARVFYRLTGRVNFGAAFLAFNRTFAWPDGNGITAESGKNPNLMGLADVNLRLFKNWDFYQGIGPMSDGTTMWKIGLNYRY